MSILPYPPSKIIEQKIASLIHYSTNLNHILQIHAFLLKTSLQSNNFLIAKLLGRFDFCSSQNLRHARSLFDQIPSPDTFLWNTMIRAYLNLQNHDECLSLFLRLRRQDHLFLDSFSLSLVVQACGRSGFLTNGQTLHTHVVKLGFHSDLFVQTGLIEMYVKFRLIDSARKVFAEMRDPDLFSYNVLLAEYVRIGEMGFARQLFDKMTERDLVSWNTMIHGYTSLGHVGPARMDSTQTVRKSHEALRLFHEMQVAKVSPDTITMVSVLSACGDIGALGMGRAVHKHIETNGIELDLKLGTSLVSMYSKCGAITEASKFFDSMRKRDVFSWSAMIVGLASHGYGDVALDHFDKMISEGIKPNCITFIGVLSACSHIGSVSKGWKHFNAMSDAYGLTREIEHYGCLVDILSRAGRLDAAREVIRNMPLEPDAVVWRALLGGCRIYKNAQLAEEAANRLVSLEDGDYVVLCNIYSEAKKWDEVVKVRKRMKELRIRKVPGSSWIEVCNVVHEFVAGDRSHPRSEEIYRMLDERLFVE